MRFGLILVPVLFILCIFPDGVMSEEKNYNALFLKGLTAPVEIRRDSFGTPYIIAQNEHDLFFAHGYLQAVDRLFQLDGIRRIPQARTSEMTGSNLLDMDTMFAEIGLDRAAKKSLEILSDDSRAMLEAFSDGVNAYVNECGDSLPLEFTMLGYKPEPWTPYDSLCAMRLVGWWLSLGMDRELFFDGLVSAYGKDIADRLYPGIPSRAKLVEKIKPGLPKAIEKHPLDKFRFYKNREFRQSVHRGTNLWVVSGSKTKSGKPILANDPHIELFSPAIWYEVGLSCPEWTSVGVVFPGLPITLIGTNGKIAWGAASFPADSQDIYREKVNPENKNQYKYDDKWLDYEIHKYLLKPKGDKSFPYEVLESIHGPVVSRDEDENLALRWTGFQQSDDIICFKRAVKSSNIKEFHEAFRDFRMMPQHFMAFDLDTDITHVMAGSIPVRDGFTGDLPNPGWESKFEWSGFLPYDQTPWLINPSEGFLNNSNNYPECFKNFDLGINFPIPTRSDRTREILSPGDDFTVDDMRAMQVDVLNPIARDILPLMLSKLDGLDISSFKNEVDMLRKWDYREAPDSIEATIYNRWWIELPKHIFSKLGIYSLVYRDSVDQCTLAMIELMRDAVKSPLWNWLELGSEMDFKLKCLVSLQLAVRSLEKDYGVDRNLWEWGKVHKIHFAHPSKVSVLLDGGSYGVGGSRFTILVSHYFPSTGFESTFGPSYRFIATIDERNRIVAKSVLPPGNWAAPLSPHFKDQAQMWVDGELKDLKVYPDEMETLLVDFILKPMN